MSTPCVFVLYQLEQSNRRKYQLLQRDSNISEQMSGNGSVLADDISHSALCGNVSLANIESNLRISGKCVALILLFRDEQRERTWVGHENAAVMRRCGKL